MVNEQIIINMGCVVYDLKIGRAVTNTITQHSASCQTLFQNGLKITRKTIQIIITVGTSLITR